MWVLGLIFGMEQAMEGTFKFLMAKDFFFKPDVVQTG
jgi:hypothetical protein